MATVVAPRASGTPRRVRLARLERPLLLSGLALIALHLLDLSLAGEDTTVWGVLAIIALPAAWALGAPRLSRVTRLALAAPVGLLAFAFATISHGFSTALHGPAWTDVTGLGMLVGGLLLVGSGIAALAAPGRPARRLTWRVAHALGWIIGALVVAQVVLLPLGLALRITHAPRLAIQESSLGVPHQELRIDGTLAAWHVPSRNGAAVLVTHGSGGSRERVAAHARMLARHGYGVLSLDAPGHGESGGRADGLGSNAQPAVDAALAWLARRPGVDPDRIAGLGVSMGGEVLLEATARDTRLRAVVSDGAARPGDVLELRDPGAYERAVSALVRQAIRGISGRREAPDLLPLVPGIAPRPVMLIAGGAVADEVTTNRAYRAAAGAAATSWEVAGAGHTAGIRRQPAEYERRVTTFLDRALGIDPAG